MKKAVVIFWFTVICVGFAWSQETQQNEVKAQQWQFHRHEIRCSYSWNILPTVFWCTQYNHFLYGTLTVSYLYRPLKWLWIGADVVNYFGEETFYWREYDFNGAVRNYSKEKFHYGIGIAPVVRFSYLNKKHITLYSGLSFGAAYLFSYIPQTKNYWQVTMIGANGAIGKNANFILGGEIGFGFKGFFNINAGYSF
ncbi:MAG: hypothetical protein LBR36_04695 [Bacteroidales bacterium]|jgi:hypothetical protein|nr:hypothetical protein [Bacteroidales bacterium]